jgi:hypothetical protein
VSSVRHVAVVYPECDAYYLRLDEKWDINSDDDDDFGIRAPGEWLVRSIGALVNAGCGREDLSGVRQR